MSCLRTIREEIDRSYDAAGLRRLWVDLELPGALPGGDPPQQIDALLAACYRANKLPALVLVLRSQHPAEFAFLRLNPDYATELAAELTAVLDTSRGGDSIRIGEAAGSILAVGSGARAEVYGGIHYYNRPSKLDTLPQNLRTNIQNFLTNYLGTADHPVPFGGRQEDLQRLEQWRGHSPKRFMLLATPAGRGKSALLTRWAQMLSAADKNRQVAAIFVPVSIRFNTNLAELFFPCIAVQLAQLLQVEVPSEYINMAPGMWQSLVGEYLGRTLPDGRQLLLIVDGLDEAAWEIGPALFPHDLPDSTRIVVSARYLADETPGPEPWLRRLGWERFDLADTMALDMLSRGGVEEALRQVPTPLAALGDPQAIVDKLYYLTRGDPLLVELYVEWLQEQGQVSARLELADLDSIEPDYRGYFRYWWEEQERLARQQRQAGPLALQTTAVLLNILASALGPLTIADVRALLPADVPSSKYEIRRAIKPLERFVIGDGEQVGYSFSHTRLSDFFREEFLDDDEYARWQQAFIAWGRRVIDRLQSDSDPDFDGVSRYLLQYFGRHLATAKAPVEAYLPLLTWEWLQSWHRYSGAHVGFLRDVDTVLQQLLRSNSQAVEAGRPTPYLGLELLCGLCFASVNSLAENMPAGLLVALRRYGRWNDEQVLAYARQKQDPESRSRTLHDLLPYLSREKQETIFFEALQAALAIKEEMPRTRMLVSLAANVPQTAWIAALARTLDTAEWITQVRTLAALAPFLPEEVLRVIQDIEGYEDEIMRVWIALAPSMPDAVWEIAREVEDGWLQTRLLTAVVPHLAGAPRAEAVRQALQAAQEITQDGDRARFLVDLAPYAPAAVCAAAAPITDPWFHTRVLASAAPFLAETECAETLDLALRTARAIAHEGSRADVLIALAPLLPEAVFAEAREIQHARSRARVLVALAPFLPDAVVQAAEELPGEEQAGILVSAAAHLPQPEQRQALTQALSLGNGLTEPKARAKSLLALAPHLPEAVYHVARDLEDETLKTRLLSAVAPGLPQPARSTALSQALHAAQTISQEQARLEALIDLVPALSEQPRMEALAAALTLALAIQDEEPRAGVLLALAPFLPETVFTMTGEIADERTRTNIYAVLAPYLPQEIYQASQAVQNERARNRVLLALAPHMPQAIYEEAQRTRFAMDQAALLVTLAPQLGDEEALAARRQALQAAITVQDTWAQKGWETWEYPEETSPANILVDLAPHLPQAVFAAAGEEAFAAVRPTIYSALTPFLPQAIYAALQDTDDLWMKAALLARVAPHLPPGERATALAQALQAARAYQVGTSGYAAEDQILRGLDDLEAVELAVPQAPDQAQPAFPQAEPWYTAENGLLRFMNPWEEYASAYPMHPVLLLIDLAPAMPAEVYEAALTIEDRPARAQVLGMLAEHLPPPTRQQALNAALQAATDITDQEERAQALVNLLPYLADEHQQQALRLALPLLDAAADDWQRIQLLAATAPYAPQAVYERVGSTPDAQGQAAICLAVLPHLPPAEQQAAAARAWQAAAVISYELSRAAALVALAPHLAQEDRTAACEAALQAAERIGDEWNRAQQLAALAPYLPREVAAAAEDIEDAWCRQTVLNALPRGEAWTADELSSALDEPGDTSYADSLYFADDYLYLSAFSHLGDDLAAVPLTALRDTWTRDYLPHLQRLVRAQALQATAAVIPVINRLGGEAALAQSMEAIKTVCRWWP